jgi:fumarate reductase subunit C
MEPVAGGVGVVLGFAVLVWFCILLPAGMARRRNRSALVWVLIGFVGSPLLAILLLIALGDNGKGVRHGEHL